MNKHLRVFLTLTAMLLPASSMAADFADKLKKAVAERMPQIKVTQVNETPVEGIYQVVIGAQVVYMTEDARYVFDGNFIDLVSKRNYSEEAKSDIRLNRISALGEANMVIYEPKKTKHTITVITDVDCPYCRRLHNEMDQYLAGGVRVRYIFMPLKGRKDMETTVTIWCSDDRNEALDLAKSGVDLDVKKCDNPIDKHLTLAREIGIQGTPAIILEDGSMLPGYVPATKLIGELEKSNVSAALNKQ